jgi:TonB family protein
MNMKVAIPRIKSFFLPILLFIFVFTTFAQTPAQLSLADILIALRSKKVTLVERNKILTDAVMVRGITFALTPEIEKELAGGGADGALIDAIRQKSPVVKPVEKPVVKPSPSATPIAVPTPTPTPAPPDFSYYQKRAGAYVNSGDLDSAISDYSKAIELKSSDVSSYLNRGMAYSQKKNYDLAIKDYDKAIELDPKDLLAYLNRADSYEKKGDMKKAAGDYEKAVALDASNESAQNNLKRLRDEISKAEAKAKEEAKPKEQETPVKTPVLPQMVNLGQLNVYALNLVKPAYPEIARKSNIQGAVTVQIMLDEEGKVISAKASDGPQIFRPIAEDAAKKSKFKPATAGGQPVKATGFIVYNFKTTN